MMVDGVEQRLAGLENKVQELDDLVNLALRLLAVANPVGSLLKSYGATETETRRVQELLDDTARRAEQGGMNAPSFAGFEEWLHERFPTSRGNREFVALLLDALKVDRPAYQQLHAYVIENWPDRPR